MEVLNDFEIKIFPKEKQAQGKAYPLDLATENRTQHLKILSSKQMFQRLPIEFPQLNMGNASENALNKTREFLYSLY